MNKLCPIAVACLLIAQGCATTPLPPLTDAAAEITFVTAQPAPRSFTNWTFFWFMPEIESDAELEYVVMQPDGKEYFRYKIRNGPAGSAIRSDFPPGLAKSPPDVFFSKPVTVTFRVNKGTIKFTRDVTFAFETAATEIQGVRK